MKVTHLPYMGKHKDIPEKFIPEVLYDPHSSMGLIVESEPDPKGSPLDQLCAVEEWLLHEHGMTFMQAVRAGISR